MRTPLPWLGLAVLTVLTACRQKDPAKCENARNVVRQGIAAEDFAAARQWRDYAYRHCADRSALEALDRELVDAEAAVQTRKAAAESKRQQTEQLIKVFTEWAGANRSNPSGAAVNVACDAPVDPKKDKERWCARERTAGEHKLRVRYWEAEPDVHEFSTTSPGDVSCDLLGGGTELKNAHGGALLHCNLTGGALAGAQALMVRTAQGTLVSVFSPKYLERDPGLQRRMNL